MNVIIKMQMVGNDYQTLGFTFPRKYLLTELQNCAIYGIIPFSRGEPLAPRVRHAPEKER